MDKPDLPCLCQQLRRADRHVSRIYDSQIRPAGLRGTQYGMLLCLENLEEPSISEIGMALDMDQTTVTRNMVKLEKLGFAETRPDSRNPHKRLARLTDSGRQALANARQGWEEAQARLRAYLGDEDHAAFIRLMRKLSRMP